MRKTLLIVLPLLLISFSFSQEYIKYLETGEIKLKGNLKDRKWDGEFTFYNMDGSIWCEGYYKKGRKHGEFIYYGFGNKDIYSKKKSENYNDGKLEGKYIHYFENGEVNSIGNYQNGKLEGKYLYYDLDGRIYWEGVYNNDLLVEEISYIGSKGPFRLN